MFWFWKIPQRPGEAWSAAGGWVVTWPADRSSELADIATLDVVARHYGCPSPMITANDVRAECARRMRALVGARDASHLDVIVSNGSREAIRLLRIRADRLWTAEEAARAATLEAVEAAIEALRAASNRLEPDPPEDYRHDRHWSE
jgi:hypothetical protein